MIFENMLNESVNDKNQLSYNDKCFIQDKN